MIPEEQEFDCTLMFFRTKMTFPISVATLFVSILSSLFLFRLTALKANAHVALFAFLCLSESESVFDYHDKKTARNGINIRLR